MASVYICHWRKEVSSDAAAGFADRHDITLLLVTKTCNMTWQSIYITDKTADYYHPDCLNFFKHFKLSRAEFYVLRVVGSKATFVP